MTKTRVWIDGGSGRGWTPTDVPMRTVIEHRTAGRRAIVIRRQRPEHRDVRDPSWAPRWVAACQYQYCGRGAMLSDHRMALRWAEYHLMVCPERREVTP